MEQRDLLETTGGPPWDERGGPGAANRVTALTGIFPSGAPPVRVLAAAVDLLFLITVLWVMKDWLTSSADPYPYAVALALTLSVTLSYLLGVALDPCRMATPAGALLAAALGYLAWHGDAVGPAAAALTGGALWAARRLPPRPRAAAVVSMVLIEAAVLWLFAAGGLLAVRPDGTFDPWLGDGLGTSSGGAGGAAAGIAHQVGIPGVVLPALAVLAAVGLDAIVCVGESEPEIGSSRRFLAGASAAALVGLSAAITYSTPQTLAASVVCTASVGVALAGALAAVRPAAPARARREGGRRRHIGTAALLAVAASAGLACGCVASRRAVAPLAAGGWGVAPGRVPLSAVSQAMQDATVAMEDGHFYVHHGFDWFAMHRALRADLRAGRVEQGGSTITQQLAKNLFLTSDRTVLRKLEEAAYTVELEHDLPKRRILELYLNAIDYGCGRHGVTAAAAYYFHEAPARLTLAQSAVLVGLVPHPPKTPDDLEQSQVAQGRQTALSRVAFFFPHHYSAADFAAATNVSLDRLMYPYRDAWDRGATDTIPAVWHGIGLFFFADPDEPEGIDHVSPFLKPALAAFLEDAKRRYGLTGIDHLGVYNDRPMRQSQTTISAHAFGQAIDVSGFRFKDGSHVIVEDHADPKVAARLAPLEALLKAHFPVVVDWRDDPLRHQTHFHCEVRGPRPGPAGPLPLTAAPGQASAVAPGAAATDPDARPTVLPSAQRLRLWGQGDLVRQTTPSSCGPACLATVLTYYLGRPTTDAEMIGLSRTQGGGSGVDDLERACNAVGYRAAFSKMTVAQMLRRVRATDTPVVALWTGPWGGHWVVVVGQRGDGELLVSDPKGGNEAMTPAQFSRLWPEGEALSLMPPD